MTEEEIRQRIKALLKNNKYSEDDKQHDSNIFAATAKYIRLTAENLGEQIQDFEAIQRGIASLNPLFSSYNAVMPATDFAIFDTTDPGVTGKLGMRVDEPIPGIRYDVPDLSRVFHRNIHGPGGLGGEFYMPRPDAIFRKRKRFENRIQNYDSFFSKEDYDFGYQENPAEFLDSKHYVPFFFEDLRAPDRRIYFRAFLTNFSENFSPEWSSDKFYGRIDEVPVYKATSRTFSIGFVIAAFSPAGFSTMWKKVNNLAKLVYPTFGSDRVLRASPMCRIRVGDVMADGAGLGLPGYIVSLDFDYSNGPWEVSEYNVNTNAVHELGRAPMIINVSISFRVIHERNPSIDMNYNMNLPIFRRIGDNGDVVLQVEDSEPNPSPEVDNSTNSDSSPSPSTELDPPGIS